jgi:thiamine monophosphate synthase
MINRDHGFVADGIHLAGNDLNQASLSQVMKPRLKISKKCNCDGYSVALCTAPKEK